MAPSSFGLASFNRKGEVQVSLKCLILVQGQSIITQFNLRLFFLKFCKCPPKHSAVRDSVSYSSLGLYKKVHPILMTL